MNINLDREIAGVANATDLPGASRIKESAVDEYVSAFGEDVLKALSGKGWLPVGDVSTFAFRVGSGEVPDGMERSTYEAKQKATLARYAAKFVKDTNKEQASKRGFVVEAIVRKHHASKAPQTGKGLNAILEGGIVGEKFVDSGNYHATFVRVTPKAKK